MTDNKEQKRVVVMGATSGIGLEVAKLFAAKGWMVGVAGRREHLLDQLLATHDNIVAAEVIDVTDSCAVEGLHRLINRLGRMDLYFHSSGIGFQNVALDAQKELSTVETNCTGMTRMVSEAFRYFECHKEIDGQIAVVSSIAATKGLGAAPAYSASKRFTTHYLESLQQLASIKRLTNIHITDIRPGFVKTPLIAGSPFPMQMDAHRVALHIVKAVEKRRQVVTINATYRLLVALWRLIPRRLWVRLRIS